MNATDDLYAWAARWHVDPNALQELRAMWRMDGAPITAPAPRTEAYAQSAVRLAAAQAALGRSTFGDG